MSQQSGLLLACTIAFAILLFSTLSESRHIKHNQQAHHLHCKHLHHQHHVRQEVATDASLIFAPLPAAATSIDAGLPSITAADALAEDIEQIHSGMNSFSNNLYAFLKAIQQWLNIFRSAQASDSSPPAGSPLEVGPQIPESVPQMLPSVTIPEPMPVLTIAPEPAESTGTSFRTITSISTRSNTVTAYQTLSFVNASSPANGTGALILPTSAPYLPVNVSFAPEAPSTLTVQPIYTTTLVVNVGGSSTYTSSLVTYSVSPTPSAYTFDATSQDNIAVYYGTSPNTQIGGLLELCASPNVDIVILSFVYDYFSNQGYPSLDFGPGCVEPNSAQQAAAPGLKDCSALAPQIAGCQQIGKKVLVSLGGYIANSSFASADRATEFAQRLWNLFGAGDREDPELRPFGPSQAITVDGFDIDNEDRSTDYYDVFAAALREHFAEDPGKTYYISAAPQCPIPDASIPLSVMALSDFVFVQFYNNPSCNLDTEDFQNSFARWSSGLSAISQVEGVPRIFVGIPSFAGAGAGYVEGAALYSRITQARELDVPNFGGIMMWEGTEGLANVDQYGVDYLAYAKDALHL